MSVHELAPLFEPPVVAVVGASVHPEKRGHQIVQSLVNGGYQGTVLPVNPKGGTILGLDVAVSLEAAHPKPDLAVLALPAPAVPAAAEAAARCGVRALVVLAVGFAESGGEGQRRQALLADVVSRTGVRVVGPNTSGILNAHLGMNLIGTPGVAKGPVAVVTQSGNLALHLMRSITSAGSGVSICLGVGNQVDVGFAEALDFLGSHEATRAVVAYVEGFKHGPTFLATCARVTRRRPVVVLKSGRTAAGQKAALSHSGAIAGPYEVLSSALVQVGATLVEREDELTPIALTLASQPADARGVAVLSDGGGQGTVASDALEASGTAMAELSSDTRAALTALLGDAAAVHNPVDLAGSADANPLVFADALQILANDEAVGSVFVIGLFGGYHLRFATSLAEAEEEAARRMAEAASSAGKGLVLHTMYATEASGPLARLRESSVPVMGSLEAGCASIAALQQRGRLLRRGPHPLGACPVPAPRSTGGAVSLSEWDAREALNRIPGLDVPFVPAARCESAGEALRAARGHSSVVLKADVEGLAHKTELSGVVLDVAESDVEEECARLLARLGAHESTQGKKTFVLVQPMLDRPLAELLLAVRYEPQVGVVATVGAGGTWTESLGDAAHVVLPCEAGAVKDAVCRLRVASALAGGRGGAQVSESTLDTLEALTRRLGDRLRDDTGLLEIEINPLFVYPDRIVAADALVVRVD